MARRDYPAPGITVHWDSELCEHSERCFRGAPTVFDPQARPWIQAGAEPPDVVAAAVDRCPSRALTYTRTDGAPPGPNGRSGAEGVVPDAAEPAGSGSPDGPEGTVSTVTVEPRRDGPLVVTGRVVLAGPDGTPSEAVERLFLCRCGASGDKPRCDGTHKRVGFTAPGVPVPRKP